MFPKRCALRERPADPSAIIPSRADSRSGTIGWSGRPSGPRLSRALGYKKEVPLARGDYLFTGLDWYAVDRHQRQQMVAEIERVDAERLLNTSVDDLAQFFAEKYMITVPELDVENLVVDQREKQIDVSHDRMRMIRDRGRPFYITGTEIEVEVPFTGEAEAFKIQPNTFSLNPPRAAIRGTNLTFSIVGTNLDADGVRREIDSTVASIQSYLGNLRNNVSGMNSQLLGEARAAIELRRKKLLASRSMVASLGFKMKERDGAAKQKY